MEQVNRSTTVLLRVRGETVARLEQIGPGQALLRGSMRVMLGEVSWVGSWENCVCVTCGIGAETLGRDRKEEKDGKRGRDMRMETDGLIPGGIAKVPGHGGT